VVFLSEDPSAGRILFFGKINFSINILQTLKMRPQSFCLFVCDFLKEAFEFFLG
jgi:hypothetical protein